MKRQKTEAPTSQADVARRGLVSVNRLDYVLQPDLSVCVSRSYKKHFFQQTSYGPSQRSICILNSGAEYVDPQNSYINYTVQNTSSVSFSLGVGSGINFIRRLILTSRSGDELERVENVNLLAPVLDRYMRSRDWLATHGQMIGYGSGEIVSGSQLVTGTELVAGESRTFVIPISCLCGLFKFDRLLPSMLVSGLRIEIEWEAAAVAVLSNAVGPPPPTISWKINQPQITLDQYQLTDSIMRVLNEEAAMRGLEIVFSSFYNHTAAGPVGGTSAAIEVRKAVSRALGVLTKIHPNTGAATPSVDYMASSQYDITSYQLRLGSLYFPQQPIKSTGGASGALYETYFHSQRGFGKIKTPSAATGVSPNEFQGVAGGGLAAIYTDLERSSTQKLTGVPVNNSRVAQIMIESASTMTDQTIDLYLHYVRLLRVFLQNVEVEE